MTVDTLEGSAIAAGKTAVYGGGAAAVFFGLTAYEIAAIVGAIIAVLGFAVQLLYSRRHDKRAAAEHEMKMKQYARALSEKAEGLDGFKKSH